MTETEILKLKRPAGSDFYTVDDFNHNVDILEAAAKSKVTTLRVCGDLNSAALVVHSSGSYAGTVVEHDDGHTYAEFILPCGGQTDITHIVNGAKHSRNENLFDGTTEWIISHKMTSYHSILAKVPDGYFTDNDSILISEKNGVGSVIAKTDMATFQNGYVADLDHQNELWHAVRTGMITSADYVTITGEAYPTAPPTRVEQK